MTLDSPGRQTFRHKQYPEYKATRDPAPDDLKPQFALLRDAIKVKQQKEKEKTRKNTNMNESFGEPNINLKLQFGKTET